ncbi:threonine synthase [Bacillota bacterium]
MKEGMIKYKSTRGAGEARATNGDQAISSAEAIIKGIAVDGGLYVPETIPALGVDPATLTGKNYREIALLVLSKFLTDYTDEELKRCVDSAYDTKFEATEVAPLVKAGNAWFLELYHGRTAAFKDMALSILPYLLTTALKKEKEDKKIAILTATSGDTGKAALEGFADVPGTDIIVFFPKDGVSRVQAMQMITQEGANTHVFGIEGNFDDAQTAVKNIFNDRAFAGELVEKGYKLSSANSINIGRLVPQVAYYVWAYIRMIEQGAVKSGESINVVVPTGNFGNILAAYYAKKMGIPIGKFICASNENKVLTDFFSSGIYNSDRDFYVTSSPSMDILISSNLERLLYHLSDAEEVSGLMSGLNKNKKYEVSDKIRRGLGDFYGGFADETATGEAIGSMYKENGYLMDTHTAVAYKVYQDYRKTSGDERPAVIASTASPYKFADSVARAIGLPAGDDGFTALRAIHEATGVRIPWGLKGLEQKEIRHRAILKKGELAEAVRTSLK